MKCGARAPFARAALALLLALAGSLEAGTGDLFAECEAAVRSRPDSVDAYRCFWRKSRQNRADEAAERLGRVLARSPGDHRARLYLARIEGDRGRDRAEPLYAQSTAGLAALGDRRGEVFARLGFVLFLGRRGRLAEVETQLAAARRTAEAAADRELVAWVRNAEGWQAFAQGDYGKAWTLFKEVETEVFPDGDIDLRAQCLSGLGGVCQETGRFAEAFEYTRRQADLCHEAGDYYNEARARGNLVLGGFRLSVAGEMEREEILALAQVALAAARAGGNRGSEARAELYLGDLTAGFEARQHYRRGLEISRETQEIAGLILGLRGGALSLVESSPRDPARARRLADQAVELARGSRFYSAVANLARARVEAAVGSRESAVRSALGALDDVEAIRNLQRDDLVRARVFAAWTFAYHRLVGFLLSPPLGSAADLALAFHIAERMRARVLLDELDAAQANSLVPLPGDLVERRAALLREIAGAQRRLMSPALPLAARRRQLGELERLELAEASIRDDFAQAAPAYAALRQPRLASLEDVQHALGPDRALLSFQIAGRTNLDNRTTENGSWLWAVTQGRARVYLMPDRDRLRPLIRLYLGLLERRDDREEAGAARLYDTLLARALSDLPASIDRLVIVPDSVLHQMPFETLRPDNATPPLGARFEVSLAPSATLWLRLQVGEAAAASSPVLAFADPRPASEVPSPAAERSAPAGALFPEPLPYARREARGVVRRLGGGSRLMVGEAASEAFLKGAALQRFAVLHFATHAVLDEQHPERSAILLSPGRAGEDGLLQIRDIVGLDLAGRLVVLSACRSAGGALLEGEGVMGLARAFFQAGAPTVVGTLWPLRDDDAARLFAGFYRHLGRGSSAAAALAAAQRERIASGAPAAAWAGVVVLGNGDAVPFPGGRPRPLATLAAGAAILATLLFAALLARFGRRRR